MRHLPLLYRAARAWTGSREDAEDLVQETVAQALARPRLLRNEDDTGYLMRAMHNTLVSQRRAAGRRPVTTPLTEELALSGAGMPDAAGIDPATATEIHVLNVPEGTATSRLSRARDRLARRLGGAQ